MDIFAHTLWAAAGARGLNAKSTKHKFNVGWTAFFGVFPDFFAFGIPLLLSAPSMIRDGVSFFRHSHHDLSPILYQYSHSIVVWALVFIFLWIVFRRPALFLFGWALHILIDIPSHSINFYPTPFLFPISEYRFPYGVSWANKWFMIINYSLLLIVFLGILIHDYRKRRKQKEAENYLASK
ncbi:MAG: hypothetical protein KBC17_00180 [Candidatus Pacebacteria bacterium]|nr:hypothetical protein [Candidatus Paceibacterota bacterium]